MGGIARSAGSYSPRIVVVAGCALGRPANSPRSRLEPALRAIGVNYRSYLRQVAMIFLVRIFTFLPYSMNITRMTT